jgi:cold shock CspA family protein
MNGEIVTWNAERYFGFIQSLELSENLFFHGSALLIAPGSAVAVGAAVEFQKDHDRTGRPRAVNIRMIDREQRAVPAEPTALDRSRRAARRDGTGCGHTAEPTSYDRARRRHESILTAMQSWLPGSRSMKL